MSWCRANLSRSLYKNWHFMKRLNEQHNDEFREIVSSPPKWLVSWGISCIFLILLFLVCGSWWIQYPDVVQASFTLTASDGPRAVVARTSGRIDRLLISDGDSVGKGATIAFIEGSGYYSSILGLQKDLSVLAVLASSENWAAVSKFDFKRWTDLGDIQYEFQVFYQTWIDLKLHLSHTGYIKRRTYLEGEVANLEELNSILDQQNSILEQAGQLAKSDFNIQEKLYKEKIISITDFNSAKKKFLESELPIKNVATSIIQNNSSILAKQKEILQLENDSFQYKSRLSRGIETLNSKIENWKYNYMLIAPTSGIVSYSAPLVEQQQITTGQEILKVEPLNSSFVGVLKISQNKIGKIKLGQKVLIELVGYPYREYGMIEARLVSFSSSPGQDSVYWGTVTFPKGLVTSYQKRIVYKNGLQGVAKIAITESRLIDRLLNLLRGARHL